MDETAFSDKLAVTVMRLCGGAHQRPFPSCGKPGMPAALCGHCWTKLTPAA